jgi:hypothetical protein
MKLIKIKGGLGNQMFQYAYGRTLEISGKKIAFDISFFYGNKSPNDTDRIFELNNFNLETNASFLKEKKENFVKKIYQKILNKLGLIDQFYQSEKYFKEIDYQIRREFTLKKPISDPEIENSNSVSVHVRRGDYVNDSKTNQYHGTCSMEYYKKAIAEIKEKYPEVVFYFFSDDIDWVKENFNIDGEKMKIGSNSSLSDCEELILMSKCKHNIIANSSFSWWAAWLNQNPDKIVIAPKKWMNKELGSRPNITPESWIKI